jgi:UDP-N-acetyl-D-glucosamine dehydrogenase
MDISPVEGETYKSLIKKINEKSAVIGVMGLGYVGLPLAATFHGAGFRTIGFDTDPSKIAACEAGTSYLEHLPDSKGVFQRLAQSETFSATADMTLLRNADAILISVPTPLGVSFEPDLQVPKSHSL